MIDLSPTHNLSLPHTEDTEDITIPSTFISRAVYLRLSDLFTAQAAAGESIGLTVDIFPDEGFSWYLCVVISSSRFSLRHEGIKTDGQRFYDYRIDRPLTDFVFVMMLFPSILTMGTILMNRYRIEQ